MTFDDHAKKAEKMTTNDDKLEAESHMADGRPDLLARMEAALKLGEGTTKGQWEWRGEGRGELPKHAYLRSNVSPRYIVMDFVRQGMQGAQPRFRTTPDDYSRMQPISKAGCNWADHPDARLIASAPTLLSLLSEAHALITAQAAEVERLKTQFNQAVYVLSKRAEDALQGRQVGDAVTWEVASHLVAIEYCAALAQAGEGHE